MNIHLTTTGPAILTLYQQVALVLAKLTCRESFQTINNSSMGKMCLSGLCIFAQDTSS